jgi:hypothetical protein
MIKIRKKAKTISALKVWAMVSYQTTQGSQTTTRKSAPARIAKISLKPSQQII